MQDYEELIDALPSVEELDEKLEEAAKRRRAQQRARMKREKERYLRRMRLLRIGIPLCLACIIIIVFIVKGQMEKTNRALEQELPASAQGNESFKNLDSEFSMKMEGEDTKDTMETVGSPLDNETDQTSSGDQPAISSVNTNPGSYQATESASMAQVNGEVVSSTAIVINRSTNEIICQRDSKARMNPASMTKVLTVLVAAEHVSDLNDTFTMTREITDYGYVNDCSSAGFLENEVITVKDLFYGTILPSGADAAVGLATYVAGSQEAFVTMMNDKLQELGLSSTTHFTNCVGIYDEQHYSTVYDMAMILEAAMDNEICREVLNARSYQTSVTEQHPEGIIISNWFLRRIEDKDTHGTVIGAKTGYVVQSGSCAASCLKDNAGNEYICVTGGSSSSWRCIYDHVALYQQLIPGGV